MPTTLEVQSTLTDRYQTTVPELVRRCLQLGKRDKVHYSIRPNGEVVLSRGSVADETSDPLLGQFLFFGRGTSPNTRNGCKLWTALSCNACSR
jgi:antitoxin PrlF